MTDDTQETEFHMDLDLDGIKDPNEPAPEGTYKVRVFEAKFQKSKNSGDDMAVVNLQIVDADEHTGKFTRDYVLVGSSDPGQKQRALWRARQYLEAAGLPTNLSNWPKLVGAEIDVELGIEPPSEGFDRETNRVRRIYI